LAKNLKQGGPPMKKDSKEAAKMEEGKPQIIQINKGEVHTHVVRLVR